ncbi:hypothetical protein SEMRO_1463_G274880.1 [Seminavis robusta]|uniref:Uncharacterized protein n=1 Tax=Seminavis robusta TaxID=568900 RepID=A0A9N8EPP4_9STRA|nr:hypothetical protein SEMRO_1463_G274880.1 [Seminavis robusta]|eukprot:Sro1463_g274880.1 n/a (180) ;mRNA; f:27812-28351
MERRLQNQQEFHHREMLKMQQQQQTIIQQAVTQTKQALLPDMESMFERLMLKMPSIPPAPNPQPPASHSYMPGMLPPMGQQYGHPYQPQYGYQHQMTSRHNTGGHNANNTGSVYQPLQDVLMQRTGQQQEATSAANHQGSTQGTPTAPGPSPAPPPTGGFAGFSHHHPPPSGSAGGGAT